MNEFSRRAEALASLDEEVLAQLLFSLTPGQRRTLYEGWATWRLTRQKEPAGDWRVWLIRAGRGYGKTRIGAEWVREQGEAMPRARIALVGASFADAVRVMVEGESGLLAVLPEVTAWRAGAGQLEFGDGAIAQVYSAEAPDTLRGPQHHAAWCDELAKWRTGAGEAAWDNLLLGLRAGERPRAIVTTTPRPNALMRRLLAMPGMAETTGRTHANPHLPASFVAAMEELYANTRLGRQELEGEMVDDVEGALWSRALFERCRAAAMPGLRRVVVAVDPPAGADGDACGIVAVGLGRDGLAYVLDDASVGGLGPDGWARAAVDCARRNEADRLVAEANNGGAMVREVLMAAGAPLPVTLVHASRGKVARAEPVATCYEAGRVRHLGGFPALEDELCGLKTGGYDGPGRSPDRADALVWAVSELLLRGRGEAAVRGL